jgi:hypothetical protein
MSGDDFFRTRMGNRFYEATMPNIADHLGSIAKSLGELAQLATPLVRTEQPSRRGVRNVGAMLFYEVDREPPEAAWSLASFIVNNDHDGDDDGKGGGINDTALFVIDGLLALDVGATFEHDDGAGGIYRYRRIR